MYVICKWFDLVITFIGLNLFRQQLHFINILLRILFHSVCRFAHTHAPHAATRQRKFRRRKKQTLERLVFVLFGETNAHMRTSGPTHECSVPENNEHGRVAHDFLYCDLCNAQQKRKNSCPNNGKQWTRRMRQSNWILVIFFSSLPYIRIWLWSVNLNTSRRLEEQYAHSWNFFFFFRLCVSVLVVARNVFPLNRRNKMNALFAQRWSLCLLWLMRPTHTGTPIG